MHRLNSLQGGAERKRDIHENHIALCAYFDKRDCLCPPRGIDSMGAVKSIIGINRFDPWARDRSDRRADFWCDRDDRQFGRSSAININR